MKKEEIIRRYGEAAYEKVLEQSRAWREAHTEQAKASVKKWREEHPEAAKEYQKEHPELVKEHSHEQNRKGGKRYDKKLEYMSTGVQGDRNRIRRNHAREFREIKDTLAEEVELHHEWIGDTAEYRGMAFVEKVAHQHGIIDMILLLDGEITVLTEEEVKNGKKKELDQFF